MRICAITGIVLWLTLVLYDLSMSGNIELFLDDASLLPVFGSCLTAALIRYDFRELFSALATGWSALWRRTPRPADVIDEMVSYAMQADRDGREALTKYRPGTKDDFTEEGLVLVARGMTPQRLESQLMPKVAVVARRCEQCRAVFKFIAVLAFPVGLMWSLYGAIIMLRNMDNPRMFGPIVAVALLTAFYGMVMACVFAFPLSGRAAAYGRRLQVAMMLRLAAFKMMAAGLDHMAVQDSLNGWCSRLDTDAALLAEFGRSIRLERREPGDAPSTPAEPAEALAFE